MKKTVSLLLALTVLLGVAFAAVPAAPALADSAVDGEKAVTEYVLLLDSTNANNRSDEQNQRIAAAQLFIDLIPADNAKLSIFAIGPKNGSFEGKSHYELLADKDGIKRDGFNWSTGDRMQTVYQIVKGQTNLDMKNRSKLKELVTDAFDQGAKYAGYSDEHCMIYAAMDYLYYHQVKNACIVFFGAQRAAAFKGYWTSDRTGGDYQDDPAFTDSLYAAINNYDDNYTSPDSSYASLLDIFNAQYRDDTSVVPYKWSFNWVDITSASDDKNPSTGNFYKELCKTFDGEAHEVAGEDYGLIPQAVVSIMDKYLEKSGTEEASRDANNNYILDLATVYSEVNVAVTGTGFTSVGVEYLQDKDGPTADRVTLTKTDTANIGKTSIWFNKQTDVSSHKFTYAAVKMILPEPGRYLFRFDSDNADKIKMQTILAEDADITLTLAGVAENVQQEELPDKSQSCAFTIGFSYNGTGIFNKDYLKDNTGVTKLHCKCLEDAQYSRDIAITENDMKSDGYSVEFPAAKEESFHSGTYEIFATVSAGKHFSAMRESAHYIVTFKNNAPVLTGGADETITGKRPGETVTLDQTQISAYTDKDVPHDRVVLTDLALDASSYSDTGDMPVDNKDHTVTLPKTAGKFIYTCTAEDNEGARADKPVTVTIEVTNEIPATVIEQTKRKDKRELYTGLNDLLINMGFFTADQKDITVVMSDYFFDPDGDAVTYYITAENFMDATEENDLVEVSVFDGKDRSKAKTVKLVKGEAVPFNGEALLLEPLEKGSGIILTLHAEDITGNGKLDETDKTYVIDLTVKSVGAELFSQYWWILVVIGVILFILIVLLVTRRVRGKWSVEIVNNQNGQSVYHEIRSFAAATNRLRKVKVPVKDVVAFILRKNEIDDDAISAADMSSRNPILYGTILPGSCKMEVRPGRNMKVKIAGNEITKAGKIKVKPRQDIMLIYFDEFANESLTVTLSFN